MDRFESQNYRSDLAKRLKEKTGNERQDTIRAEKTSIEYWDARTQHLKEQQEPTEERIDNGRGLLIHRKHLFHGSAIEATRNFLPAQDTTVGPGVYLTSGSNEAIGYAEDRAQKDEDGRPTLYEVSVENIKLIDLRQESVVREVLSEFRTYLESIRKTEFNTMDWADQGAIDIIFNRLDAAPDNPEYVRAGQIKYIAGGGPWFTNFVRSRGYDGLITMEGGDFGVNHDTYLIYDPSKVQVVREQTAE